MAGRVLPTRARAIDLEDPRLGLDEGDKQWLRDKLDTARITHADLDQLRLSRKLTPNEERIIVGLERGARGEIRASAGLGISKNGASDDTSSNVLALEASKKVAGEPAPLIALRAELPEAGLWGQEQRLDDFVQLGKDSLSRKRLTPAVMSLSGDPAHGKDQALSAFTRIFFGDKASVIEVDLSACTDMHFDDLFGKDAPLELAALKKLEKKGQALLRLKNGEGLPQRAPKIAAELQKRLLARRGEAGYVPFPYVFDVDRATPPGEALNATIGPIAGRVASAKCQFAHLDGPTMLRYAEPALKDILAQLPGENLRIDFDREPLSALGGISSLDALGEMLATPHTPLDALEHRLLRFVLTHLDTQTSINRANAALRVGLAPHLAGDKAAYAALLTALHAEDADLLRGQDAFTVFEVGEQNLDPELRARHAELPSLLSEELKKSVDQICAKLFGLAEAHPEAAEVATELFEATALAEEELAACEADVAERQRLGLLALVGREQHDALASAMVGFELGLGALSDLLQAEWTQQHPELSSSVLALSEIACAVRLAVAKLAGAQATAEAKDQA